MEPDACECLGVSALGALLEAVPLIESDDACTQAQMGLVELVSLQMESRRSKVKAMVPLAVLQALLCEALPQLGVVHGQSQYEIPGPRASRGGFSTHMRACATRGVSAPRGVVRKNRG
jgi:hypothetical protein